MLERQLANQDSWNDNQLEKLIRNLQCSMTKEEGTLLE